MANGIADASPKQPRKRPARPRQKLIKLTHAEEEYGPPYRTWYDLYLRGQLPAVRINRSLWFERADIERLITDNKAVLT